METVGNWCEVDESASRQLLFLIFVMSQGFTLFKLVSVVCFDVVGATVNVLGFSEDVLIPEIDINKKPIARIDMPESNPARYFAFFSTGKGNPPLIWSDRANMRFQFFFWRPISVGFLS